MTREEIIEKTIETLTDEFDVNEEEIVEDAPIYQTLHLDSLSLVDLVAVVHYTFKFKFHAEYLPNVKTFGNLYDYIESHMA